MNRKDFIVKALKVRKMVFKMDMKTNDEGFSKSCKFFLYLSGKPYENIRVSIYHTSVSLKVII